MWNLINKQLISKIDSLIEGGLTALRGGGGVVEGLEEWNKEEKKKKNLVWGGNGWRQKRV